MTTTALDNTTDDPRRRAPLVLGGHTYASVTDKICGIVERPETTKAWKAAFGASVALTGVLGVMVVYLFLEGIGVWGLNKSVGWGFAIINFVFWIGIGHAGTLISAILLLFRQKWRTSINRFAEAMTIIAVSCAGIFPAIHVGRVWFIYWVFPVPNQMQMWPNFRSPLVWDVFAVSTYATVSLLFWYMGMIPDLASLRDRAVTKVRRIAYGLFALGWRGSQRHWHVYEVAYLLLAALATPLVLSVHSVVSFDFAVAQLPGWHTTIFPPYFVVGAIFSGFAMVMMLIVPAREWFGLKEFVTKRHLENMAKIILATGSIVGYAYAVEVFIAWYGGNSYEGFAFLNRAFGTYAWAYWIMVSCNVLAPQLFWFKKIRRNPKTLLLVAVLVNVGMWFERFVIVVSSLSRDYLPGSWNVYVPTWVDYLTLAGSFGLFFTLFLLFVRYLPMMAMAEVKAVMADEHHGDDREETAEVPQKAEADLGEGEPAGFLVEFDHPEALKAAAQSVRDAGYTAWDAHSPFPVHGLDGAMGVRRTKLPLFVFGGAATGAVVGLLLQWWTNAVDYPQNISGKPFFSLPANIPVTFELTILLAAFGAFVGMLALNRLPQFWHRTFTSDRFRRVTSDRFFISIEAEDPYFDREATPKFLEGLGGRRISMLEDG
ncbi:MAG: quinol:electron acceptor oxidoreductase subunit ActD [Planctomycetota bacterium]|jgi:molybdopterin-containing oxidoreductase family membrane subunit